MRSEKGASSVKATCVKEREERQGMRGTRGEGDQGGIPMAKDNCALAAIEGLWRVLWNSPPPQEVVRALELGEAVRVKHYAPRSTQGVVVELGGREGLGERYLHLQADRTPKSLHFLAAGQKVLLEMEGLVARRGRVFVEIGDPSRLKKVLEEVRLLDPLFSSMGLGDLEEALEALATIEDGEARTEGPYVLVRKGSRWTLGRRALFGDPILDRKFMAGEEAAFSHPEGVAICLKADLTGGWMRIREGRIRWGTEAVEFRCAGGSHFVNEDALRELLRCGLLGALDCAKSLRMRTLIEGLLEEEDPLGALKEGGFIERVKVDALAKF